MDFLSVQNTNEGILPSTEPGNALQGNLAENASACDCRQWAFGVSGTFSVDLNSGSLSTESVGPDARLDVRGVRARGTATIHGEMLTLGEAQAGRVAS